MKSNEELNALKKEVKNLNKKLCELTEEELAQVSGGIGLPDRSGGRVIVVSGAGVRRSHYDL